MITNTLYIQCDFAIVIQLVILSLVGDLSQHPLLVLMIYFYGYDCLFTTQTRTV